MIETGIRGGKTHVIHRYATANKKLKIMIKTRDHHTLCI